MTDNSSSNQLIQKLLNLLADSGVTSEQLYSATGVQRNHNFSEAEIPKLLQTAVTITEDPGLIIKLGRQLDIASLGTFGFALMSCATLRDALQLLLRYLPITGSGISLHTHEYNDLVALGIRLELGNPQQQQLITELIFSQIDSATEFLINRSINTGEFHFNYRAPSQADVYKTLFSAPIKFDQPLSQFVIPTQTLDTRISTANPAAYVIFQQQCEDMLRGLNRVENYSATVRRQLINAGGIFPSIGQVAEQLHVSERTLKRRLNHESNSFRAICNEVKNVLACQYLKTTKMTVAEIASLLGYSEAVSFRRAFFGWNEMTPSEYRHPSTVPASGQLSRSRGQTP